MTRFFMSAALRHERHSAVSSVQDLLASRTILRTWDLLRDALADLLLQVAIPAVLRKTIDNHKKASNGHDMPSKACSIALLDKRQTTCLAKGMPAPHAVYFARGHVLRANQAFERPLQIFGLRGIYSDVRERCAENETIVAVVNAIDEEMDNKKTRTRDTPSLPC
jgi:hypothetical protein